MLPPDLQARLARLDAAQLTDVVRNYRQYGYSPEVRAYALTLLEAQGISPADLHLAGQLDNRSYDQAERLYAAYTAASRWAFACYGAVLALNVVAFFARPGAVAGQLALSAGIGLGTVFYLFFLFRSFLSQSAFYRATGDSSEAGTGLAYLFLGMPLYVVMYFVFRQQMAERLQALT